MALFISQALTQYSKPVSVVENGEQLRQMRSDHSSGDENIRKKMVVEGQDDSWTVDCLRRRLLAERAASKAAKEDAELIGIKLIELEKELKSEIKSRNRAEKLLKLATKKLELLKLSSSLGQSSSLSSEVSRCSAACSSGLLESDDINGLQNSASFVAHAVGNQESCNEQRSKSFDIAPSSYDEGASQDNKTKFQESLTTIDPLRPPSEKREVVRQKADVMDYADYALAIVPANVWPESACDYQINNKIDDVLLALRHAKESLQSSIGIRCAAQAVV